MHRNFCIPFTWLMGLYTWQAWKFTRLENRLQRLITFNTSITWINSSWHPRIVVLKSFGPMGQMSSTRPVSGLDRTPDARIGTPHPWLAPTGIRSWNPVLPLTSPTGWDWALGLYSTSTCPGMPGLSPECLIRCTRPQLVGSPVGWITKCQESDLAGKLEVEHPCPRVSKMNFHRFKIWLYKFKI